MLNRRQARHGSNCADTPAERELHVILANDCTHKKRDARLALHPNAHSRFTPTSASWLNQVEIWFGILSRTALRGAGFKNVTELRQAIRHPNRSNDASFEVKG
jgi:transposase